MWADLFIGVLILVLAPWAYTIGWWLTALNDGSEGGG